jgi:hypothetical protein
VIAQLGIVGDCAVPFALHAIAVPLSVPDAVPCSFKSPAHVALNDPLAVVPVCSLGFHLKSVQVVAVGTMAADAQLPTSDPTAVELGEVPVVLLS